MNGVLLMVVAAAVLACGYLGYGRWLANKWGVDKEALTPAKRMKDGKSFSPVSAFTAFSHQFSSICGAGPVTGTIVAMAFGWLPVVLWVLVGGIFFGAVHDFGALYASMKNNGKSLAQLIEKYIGKTGRRLFLLFCWLFCIIVIAAFTDMVCKTFMFTPVVDASGAATGAIDFTKSYAAGCAGTISILFTFVAMAFGWAQKKFNLTGAAEFVTGVVLEKLFHTRWWDYSDMPFNIKGHVCLMFTVLWGLACTFVMRILHPIIMSLFHIMPQPLSITLLSLFCAAMLADAVATACTVHKLSKKLKRITELAEELHRLSDELGENIYDTVAGLEHRATSTREWWDQNVQPHLDELDETVDRSREALSDYMEQRRDDLEEARARYREGMAQLKQAMHRNIWESRLMSAFPKAHDNRYEQALERLKQNYARKRKKRDAQPEDRP